VSQPLKAAGRVAEATPLAVARSRNNSQERISNPWKSIDLQHSGTEDELIKWRLLPYFVFFRLRCTSIVKSAPACLVTHGRKPFPADDRRKRQTSTAIPAEPGDLPLGVRVFIVSAPF
jgi:hypothetical protein